MNVAIIGASDKPERYSYMAFKQLTEKGHTVFLVHQRLKEIEGVKVYPSISDITDAIDTVTLYVSADISSSLTDAILAKKPRRIIFNPGAENPEFMATLQAKGIVGVEACTLVMLRTKQF